MPLDETHVDDDVLALLALGEDVGTPDERAHVARCERCAAEVAALGQVALLAKESRDALVAPAPHVWDRVAAELHLGAGGRVGAGEPEPPTSVPVLSTPVPSVPVSSGPVSSASAPAPVSSAGAGAVGTDSSEQGADVVPLTRRRTPWAWVAGAAAAGLVIGGAGVGWVASRDDDRAEVVASAALEPLPGWDAEGTARVEVQRDGERVLVVDVADGHADDGFREVWLLRPDVSGLVSLGTLTGDSGRFDLPPGLDLDDFSVVDVSLEPFDGDPAHSGDSIVRGPLEA
ncbi:anti-sigma factor [Cellulomonas persica]|uniref:Anti-sigma K factor RskA C-terminal domain-containing protein n=1 Tax=Cellulomonas persica TaxID=76861 RepID=A0A510V0R4_9CELL|nr:anti-sigma factor [Cellulomonas persica]GEK19391.1 hypothetical protein CPE01_31240 [Cellulomonas persica]